MTLKFYTLFTLLFMVLLGNFVYFFITKESTPLDIFGIHLAAYPVAIWVTLPFFLFYFLNVILMSVSQVQNYLKLRNYERDFDKLIDAIYHGFLHKVKHFEYKTERYQLLGNLIAHADLYPKKGSVIEEPAKIGTVFEVIELLDAGKVADLRKYNLSKNNPLMIANAKNLLKSDVKSAENILTHSDNYDDMTLKEAFGTFAKEASASNLLKYKTFVSIEATLRVINRIDAEEHPLEIAYEDLLALCEAGDFNALAYIDIARALKTKMVPEDRMRFFEALAQKSEDAVEAELYTLLDLQMIDQAKELLDNYTIEDYPKFRAFLALKECNHPLDIDQIVAQYTP